MDIVQAIQERKSIRAFKPEQVPHNVIEDILNLAIHSPSAINLQPWEFYIVSGEEKNRLSRTLMKAYKEKEISCGPSIEKPLPKEFSSRGAKTLQNQKPYIEQMNVTFNTFVNEGSCTFYDAPTAIIICIDDAFSKIHLLDIGLILGYILLSAHNYGLSTCPIGLITSYEDEIKELFNISDNKKVIIGIALGYANPEIPVNQYKSTRESLNILAKWIE